MKGPLLEDRARVGLIRVFFVVDIRKDQFRLLIENSNVGGLQANPLTFPPVLCSRPYRMAKISGLTPGSYFPELSTYLLSNHGGF